MQNTDLHIHSVYSDGTLEPLELIKLVKEKNLTTIALTDHDNIVGSKEIIKYNNPELNIYSGVELSAKVPKGTMHILGYNIDLDNEALNNKLNELKEYSKNNMLLYIDLLKKDYQIDIPEEDKTNLLNLRGNIGRPQLALILIKLGYCTTVQECFDKYLNPMYEKLRNVKKSLTKEECINLINNAGGIASLAHPNSLKLTNEELEQEIIYLKSIGLKSIETIHSDLNESERIFLHSLALKYNLLESGGTDFHGIEVKPDTIIGTGKNNNVSIDSNILSLTKTIPNRYRSK